MHRMLQLLRLLGPSLSGSISICIAGLLWRCNIRCIHVEVYMDLAGAISKLI